MAFTVEDGTGVEDANSLCSVEFADAYFADRAITAWTGDAAAKQTALVRATDYIETRFGHKFRGCKAEDDQALSWPRVDVSADDTVPVGIRKAASEYALRALTATLLPDPEYDASGRVVVSKREKVGPIEESAAYLNSSGIVLFKAYPAADALLRPWLNYATGLIRA